MSRLAQAMADYAAHDWPAELRPWGVALQTSRFDVLEVASPDGAMIHHSLLTRVPTATVRPAWWSVLLGPSQYGDQLRWLFVLAPGVLDPGRVADSGGLLHCGPDAWVPAPPGRTPHGLTVGWVVPPQHTKWRAYSPDGVLDRLGWS